MSDSEAVRRLNAALEGRYTIERELGEGGMATVYLAEDLKHERKVALKVLKPELAAVVGAERFLAEIKTTANLTHPHILPLHDSGEADSFLFYVMPFVEGESLRDRLDREHQLPVDEAVRIASDMAEALDYAHRHGVIHRDIKPANVLLVDGKPEIADFGIALALGAAGGDRMTETGLSVGTPHYMSPEQATGDVNVGPATDVYALGCVLYEMLIGEPPYTGSTPQAILGKIIMGEPESVRSQRKSVPANVDAAVATALEKLPADRFASAHGFAEALADPGFAVAAVGAGTGRRREGTWKRIAMLSTSLAMLLAVVSGGVVWRLLPTMRQDGQAGPSIRVPVSLVGFPGGDSRAVLTPDCTGLFYFSGGELTLRRLSEMDARPIHSLAGATSDPVTPIMMAPDGHQVAFFLGGDLWVVPIEGGQAVMIASDLGSNPGWYGGAWGPDDYIYFTPDGASGISRISSRGGEAQGLTVVDAAAGEVSHRFPWLLPNGQGLLFTSWSDGLESATVVLRSMETGATELVGTGLSARYAPTGHLVYGRADGSLQAVLFDLAGLEVKGTPVTVESGLFVHSMGDPRFTFCDQGVLAYETSGATQDLLLLGRDGRERPVDKGHDFGSRRFSRDGSRLAVTRQSGVSPGNDIWVYDLDQGGARRVTAEGNDYAPTWSPDDEFIAFYSDRAGSLSLFKKRSDGSGLTELLLESDDDQFFPDWSSDGRWLSYTEGVGGSRERDLWLLPFDGGEPEPLVRTPVRETGARFSPDGRYVAYRRDGEVWVVDVENRDSNIQVSVGGGRRPQWLPDQGELSYLRQDQIVVVTVETDPTFAVLGEERVLFDFAGRGLSTSNYEVSPNGNEFAIIRSDNRARITLVTNWFDELKRLVPN